jgi:uncharacterized protein DUF1320
MVRGFEATQPQRRRISALLFKLMWNPLLSADLQQKLSDDEFAAVTSASLPDGVTANDIISEELSRTVNEVRGFVAGHKANILGAAGTIPDELQDAALVIVRFKVFTRLPGLKALLDELRVKEYDEAMRKLRDVSAGRFALVQPINAAPGSEQAAPSTIGVVSAPPRQNTKSKLKGLF